MWKMLWPLMLVVASNCIYHICEKSMPEGVNTFGALTVTYLVGAVLSAILLLVSAKGQWWEEITKVNWVPFALGFSIVGLEAGFLFFYRAGWKISSGSLAANITLAAALLVIGVLLYHESVSPKQLVGMGVCALGLFLVSAS